VQRLIGGNLPELPMRANWKRANPEKAQMMALFANPGPLTESDRKLLDKLR
jgi:hypothetical protein